MGAVLQAGGQHLRSLRSRRSRGLRGRNGLCLRTCRAEVCLHACGKEKTSQKGEVSVSYIGLRGKMCGRRRPQQEVPETSQNNQLLSTGSKGKKLENTVVVNIFNCFSPLVQADSPGS